MKKTEIKHEIAKKVDLFMEKLKQCTEYFISGDTADEKKKTPVSDPDNMFDFLENTEYPSSYITRFEQKIHLKFFSLEGDDLECKKDQFINEATITFFANQISTRTVRLHKIFFYVRNDIFYHKIKFGALVLEYMKFTVLDLREQKLSKITRLQIALELAKGLKELHENDMVHRDISYTNALVNEKFQVKFSDFENAATREDLDPSSSRKWGNPSQRIGVTPCFASPEYIDMYYRGYPHDFQYDPFTTDIYSFGGLLIELFTGKYNREQTKYDFSMDEHEIITLCHNKDPALRASPADIVEKIEALTKKTIFKNCYDITIWAKSNEREETGLSQLASRQKYTEVIRHLLDQP